MYIILNKGANMSTGKAAAQAGHAAVEAYRRSKPELVDAWYEGGHFKKIVLEAQDAQQLGAMQVYIQARGFRVVPIIDEGYTEVDAFTLTAVGVEIVDKDDPHVAATFGTFRTYREREQARADTERHWWQRG